MTLKYSLSHLMLVFVIVGLICAWVLECRTNKLLATKLDDTRSKLAKTIYTTKECLIGAQYHLDNLKADWRFDKLHPLTQSGVLSITYNFEKLVKQGMETLDSEGLRGYGIGTMFSPKLDEAPLSSK